MHRTCRNRGHTGTGPDGIHIDHASSGRPRRGRCPVLVDRSERRAGRGSTTWPTVALALSGCATIPHHSFRPCPLFRQTVASGYCCCHSPAETPERVMVDDALGFAACAAASAVPGPGAWPRPTTDAFPNLPPAVAVWPGRLAWPFTHTHPHPTPRRTNSDQGRQGSLAAPFVAAVSLSLSLSPPESEHASSFRPCLVVKNFQDSPSHRILRRIHEALNIHEKNN